MLRLHSLRSPAARRSTLPVLAAVAAMLLAACGGSSKPSGPSTTGGSGNVSFKTAAADAYKFSDCMRSHGVTGFQDPRVSSGNGQQQIAVQVNPSITGSPDFKSAQKACIHLIPGGQGTTNNGPSAAQQQARTNALLAFANCMRKRGFPRFPDPNSQGQLTLPMIASAGINLKEPAVEPAADACSSLTHGILTKADIAQAIANPNGSGSQSSSAGSSGG